MNTSRTTWERVRPRRTRCQLCCTVFPLNTEIPKLAVCHTCRAKVPTCEQCSSSTGVEPEPSYTAYHTDKVGWDNPNRPCFLCRDCAEEIAAYWAERWGEYYANL